MKITISVLMFLSVPVFIGLMTKYITGAFK